MENGEKFIARLNAADRFCVHNNIRLLRAADGSSEAELVVTDDSLNAGGVVQGGAIFTLADFAFAVACNNAHRPSVAQQASLNFLNASRGKRLISTAYCVKNGRSSCVYRIEIKDDLGKDIAQAMFTGFKL